VKYGFSSVRVRLTLWYSLVLAVIILVFSLGVFFFVKAGLLRQLNRQLDSDFLAVSQVSSEEPNEVPEAENENSSRIFQLVKGGKVLFETPAFKRSGLPVLGEAAASGGRTVLSPSGARFRLRTAPVGPDLLLSVAVEEEPVRGALRTLAIILLLSLPAALALAGLGGYLMAGRLLRPVSIFAARAEKISAENLSARLPVENPDDEFGQLAGVVNRMLSRLEEAFERLRRFTADASHELRTPLTVIRSVGEVALQEDLDAAAYRDRIGSMLEDVSRLTRLVDSLLVLTRADSGFFSVERKEADAARLVERAVEDMRPLAEEKDLELTLVPGGRAPILADEATVRLALVNLLDNAIKYTPASGVVTVCWRVRGDDLLIEVADTGCGIPPGHGDRIFDRFYRLEKDRSGQSGGAGLGLAIAKWAAEANGGRIEWESREKQGSTFRLVFPMDRKADEPKNP
jgi:heavy metal sensor kinase